MWEEQPASVIISPNPFVLTMIAIFAAFLGAILKKITSSTSSGVSFDPSIRAFLSGPVLAAAIIALVFFNIYEFTTIGDKFKMPVSWRSALLIGLLVGLFDDQFLAALKAFAGSP